MIVSGLAVLASDVAGYAFAQGLGLVIGDFEAEQMAIGGERGFKHHGVDAARVAR